MFLNFINLCATMGTNGFCNKRLVKEITHNKLYTEIQ